MKKSSTSGTTHTGKSKDFISCEEVCKIIEVAAKRGVAELKFGVLELKFGPALSKPTAPGPTIPAFRSENVLQEQQIEHEKAILSEEIRTREEQVAELMISDPLAAEEMMLQEEVERVAEEEFNGNDATDDDAD